MTAVVHTLKKGSVYALTTTGASCSNGTAKAAGSAVDFGATSGLQELLMAVFELKCQFGTITGIVQGTVIADVYFVPRNIIATADTADMNIDTTASTSFIPSNYRVGACVAGSALLANTDYYFQTAPFELDPRKGTYYIIPRAGQTVSVNWSASLLPWNAQSN